MSNATELTAYCGLYCADCIRYRSRASGLARDLLIELQNKEFNEYAKLRSSSKKQFDSVKQFENYKQCCEVLEAMVALQCHQPCRIGGGCSTFSCGIFECCRMKGFEGCWQCDEFESCEKFEPLHSIHGATPQ
ncbi:DUF3795 domain-containing protein [Chloroflexota bacterium]